MWTALYERNNFQENYISAEDYDAYVWRGYFTFNVLRGH